jgi:porin
MFRLLINLVICFSLASVVLAQESGESAIADPDDTQTSAKPFDADNPGSITERIREKEALKDKPGIPWMDRNLKPWYNFKDKLSEEHGLNFNVSFNHLYQWASHTVGSDNDASGYEFIIYGTWNFAGRGTDSPTTIGFEAGMYDNLGTHLAPLELSGQVGSLYPTAAALDKIDPSVGELWIQQIFDRRFGFRFGRVFPISTYDFFPLKNFRTDFTDSMNGANLAIPLPTNGLGGFVMYKPQPNIYVRSGLHDANADREKFGLDTYDDELFKIFEVGFDPGITERQPGRPPSGDIHVSFWQQDEREDAGVADGWGLVVSGSQRFGRFLPFLRYGYADVGFDGPTLVKHTVSGGFAVDEMFGRKNDRLGIGLTWSNPSNTTLDDQGAIDMFYRIQISRRLSVSPVLHFIIDPVNNPDEDEIIVLGIRTLIVL